MEATLEAARVEHLANLVAQVRAALPSQVPAFLMPETTLQQIMLHEMELERGLGRPHMEKSMEFLFGRAQARSSCTCM